MYGSGGIGGPIWDLFKKDPKLEQMQFDINPAIAGYYRSRASDLEAQRAGDVGYQDQALAAYQASLPGLDKSTASDQSFIESMRPGGPQERRFSDLIRGYMDKTRAASQVGLQRARAQQKARSAIGGNSAFADSGYRQAQRNAMESGFEADLAAKEGAAQLANANQFAQGYRPGASLALANQANQYRMSPLATRGVTEQLGSSRASNVLGGLRGSIDTMYQWKQPKNWASYVSAVDQTGANVLDTALSVYSAARGNGYSGGLTQPSSGGGGGQPWTGGGLSWSGGSGSGGVPANTMTSPWGSSYFGG